MAVTAAAQQRDTIFTWSKVIPAGGKLAIGNRAGIIEVRESSTDRVEIRGTVRRDVKQLPNEIAFTVREPAPNEVEICTVYLGVSACEPRELWMNGEARTSVRFIVDLPKGLRLQANTGAGDVLVMQSVNEIDISTGSGDVVVRESLGRAAVSTGSGDVTIAAANGPVRASTGNGDVLVHTAHGPVNANSGNGDLDVRIWRAASQGPEPATMTISSGNGEVRVSLPSTFNGEIDADSGNGKVASDFDVRGQGRSSDSRLRGPVGTGQGPRIRLHSGNGRVEIRKG